MSRLSNVSKVAAFVSLVLLTLGTLVPAMAQSHSNPSEVSGRHCAMHIAPVKPGQKMSTVLSNVCFATFSEAVSYVTNGRFNIAGLNPSDITPSKIKTMSNTIVAVDYEHDNKNGISLITYGNFGGCLWGNQYYFNLPGWMNDRISSSTTSNDCNRNVFYEHHNHWGASVDCGANCSYIGDAMNDRASSRRLAWM